MNDTWKKRFKNYIADFHAIDKLNADGIIGERETASLKNKLLVEIIVTAEREVWEWTKHLSNKEYDGIKVKIECLVQ